MKHRHKQLITRHWVARCRDAGIEMDLHVNRHLVAKLVLDQDPTAMSLVQEILGHEHEETTRAYYADVNKALVHKKFQGHLEEIEKVLTTERSEGRRVVKEGVSTCRSGWSPYH